MNPYQTYQGAGDAFVTKLAPAGSSLVYSTYLGGSARDFGQGIAVDGSGEAYVIGQTVSTNFPTLNPYQATNQGGYDAFVTKLAPAGSTLVYSTYLGGSFADWGNAIAVDNSGATYITGLTYSNNFPIQNPYSGQRQAQDAFIVKLSDMVDYTVNVTDDTDDGACEPLGTGDCTLREAINAANASPGTDTITFNIPGAGPHAITLLTELPAITDPVIIDGTTQPGASCDAWPPILMIEIASSHNHAPILTLAGNYSVVRGLVLNTLTSWSGTIRITSNNNAVECSYIGTGITGTTTTGVREPALFWMRALVTIEIGTDGNGIGDDSEGNVINVVPNHILITGNDTGYNVIAGNRLHVDAAGTTVFPDFYEEVYEIHITDTDGHNRIGTNGDGISDDAERNVLGGLISPITIDGAPNNVIAGNDIGTDHTGTLNLGNYGSIYIVNSSGNIIGGTTQAEANRIAFSGTIIISSNSTQNTILGNTIYANPGLGIDLVSELYGLTGVITPNDPGDADTGPNNLQNYPVLTNATSTTIEGMLNSTPNSTFTLHFYSNSTCDDLAYGEGEFYQPTTTSAVITTDANGDAAFNFTFVNTIPDGYFITATATDAGGNTSEFSRCSMPINIPLSFTVTNTNDSGPGSLRQAIINANIAPGQNTISFDISGTDPHTDCAVIAAAHDYRLGDHRWYHAARCKL